MSFNIIKSDEEMKIQRIVGLIYGFPGAGKTSTANTSNNPLTLDFDSGSHRSGFRKDVLRIRLWEDIQSDLKSFLNALNDYDTVVIDTITACLDYIGEYLIRNEPKLGKNKLQYFGALKDTFNKFVQTLKANGKDLIFIAQVKEKEENGISTKKPDITGGSYDIVTSLCDFIGYLYYKDRVRELDFEPTEEYIGKNPMNFDKVELPNYTNYPNYFAERMQGIKDSLGSISQQQKEAIETIREILSQIKSVKNADELNVLVDEIKEANYSKNIMAQIRVPIPGKMKELGLLLNRETGLYEPIKEEPATIPDEPSTKKPKNSKKEKSALTEEYENAEADGGKFF